MHADERRLIMLFGAGKYESVIRTRLPQDISRFSRIIRQQRMANAALKKIITPSQPTEKP
jgi:hypothetical protein